jgi:hypothetical protein
VKGEKLKSKGMVLQAEGPEFKGLEGRKGLEYSKGMWPLWLDLNEEVLLSS